MDHSIIVEKFGIRLRPVQLSDAGAIVNLRNNQHALGFVGDSVQTEASQREWLQEYFSRPGDYYFIIEVAYSREMVGTVGVYNIEGKSGESGRWILLPGTLAASASAWLSFHVCFEILNLDVVRGTVVESNTGVVSFHKRIGHRCTGMAPEPRTIAGKPVNILEYRLTRPEWPKISANLTRYALMAEKLLTRANP